MTIAERFEAFLLEFQDMVYATAVRLLGNRAEAEDVAQTVFLKAFERFGELDGNPSAPGCYCGLRLRHPPSLLRSYRGLRPHHRRC